MLISITIQPSGSSKNDSSNGINNNDEWISLSPKSLWKQINEEAESYYKFELNSDNVDGICEVFDLQKISLMRAICKVSNNKLRFIYPLSAKSRHVQLETKKRQLATLFTAYIVVRFLNLQHKIQITDTGYLWYQF